MSSSGSQAGPSPPSIDRRVTATWIASSGLSEDTDQSLPPAILAPPLATLPIGYSRPDRSGPRIGSVSFVMYSSG